MDCKWLLIPILLIFLVGFTQFAFSSEESYFITSLSDFQGGPDDVNVDVRPLLLGKDVFEEKISPLGASTNCGGALATDGEWLYVKCWNEYGGGSNSGGNLQEDIGKFDPKTGVHEQNLVYPAKINKSISIAYLNGYIYNGYTNGDVIERINATNGEVSYVETTGLVCSNTGEIGGDCGTNLLITSDGQFLYNLAYNTSGSDGEYKGWIIRKFNSQLQVIDEIPKTNEEFYYIRGILGDGDYIYALEWTDSPDARVIHINLETGQIERITRIDQYPLKWVNGQYDWVNKKFWLGDLYSGKVYKLTAPEDGIILEIDNTDEHEKEIDNQIMIVYFKMNDDEYGDIEVIDYTKIPTVGEKAGDRNIKTGKFGGARYFDTANDLILTSPSQEFNDAKDLSVELWVYFESITSTQVLFSAWVYENGSERMDLTYVPDLGFVLSNNISGSNSLIYAPRDINAREWYHIAFTIDDTANEWKIYVNGRELNSSVEGVSIDDMIPGWNITLGSLQYDFNGRMDQFIVYNITLDPEEIYNDYLLGKRYFSSGEYISKVFLQERATSWYNLSWVWYANNGDIDVEFRTSDKYDEDWTNWVGPLTKNPSNPFGDYLNDSAKYIQFKATLLTSDVNYPAGILSFNLGYNAPDVELPDFISYDVTPKVVYVGDTVNISVNASDENDILSVVGNFTLPDGSYELKTLVNNGTYEYSTEDKGDGTFTLEIIATDSVYNEDSVTVEFHAMNATIFNLTVTNRTGEIPATIKLYYPGTKEEIDSHTEPDGIFENKNIPDYNYDIEFDVFDGKFIVNLENVDMSENLNEDIVFDMFNGSIVYFVNSTYTSSDANVRLSYAGTDMEENKLRVFSCDKWYFTQKECGESMDSVSFSVYKPGDYFDVVNVGSLIEGGVAFVIDESWCGDGKCDKDYENVTSCDDDCVIVECEDEEERLCSVTYEGVCAVGNETCVDGSWSGCPSSSSEVCNGIDDDCDGTIDDVDGKDSVEETQCRCYDDGSPYQEECNGIDDDCDDEIDEGAECCEESSTRNCGTNVGACEYGTSYCMNQLWGECIAGTGPEPTDICGDNVDNDCDGDIDEGCDHCNNRKQDYDEEGIDCGGETCIPCAGFPWWILIVVGAVIIGMMLFLMKSFKKEGKELTWQELRKKYTPAERP